MMFQVLQKQGGGGETLPIIIFLKKRCIFMAKKFLLGLVFLLIALCSSAFAENPHLVTIHETVVHNIYSQDISGEIPEDGTDYVTVGVSFDTAEFFCVTLEVVNDEGEMPYIETFCPPSISFDLSGGKYSFWNSYKVESVNNTPKTFTTARTDSLFYNPEEALRARPLDPPSAL